MLPNEEKFCKILLWKIFHFQKMELYFSKPAVSKWTKNVNTNINIKKRWIPLKSPKTAGIGCISLGCICHFLHSRNKTPKHHPQGFSSYPSAKSNACKSEVLAAGDIDLVKRTAHQRSACMSRSLFSKRKIAAYTILEALRAIILWYSTLLHQDETLIFMDFSHMVQFYYWVWPQVRIRIAS